MASRPPMKIWRNYQDYFDLVDFEERRFKTIIPHSAGRNYVGVTCGYLILYALETCDFLVVNPITRHQLHFPDLDLLAGAHDVCIRAILVFSPSMSGWVFVVLHRTKSLWWSSPKLSFYMDGKKGWNHVSSTTPILDLHFFKGKIYTLHNDHFLGELRLYPNRECKWALLETRIFAKQYLYDPELVSSCENLYLISHNLNLKKVMEVDIGEMKWVFPEKTIEEYAFFFSRNKKSCAAMKLESWAGLLERFKSYCHFLDDDKTRKCMFTYTWMWYFPHDCLTIDILDE